MTSLASQIRALMHIDPEAPAIEFQGRWHSWGELGTIVGAIETALAAAGIPEGSRVAGILRNTPETAAALVSIITSSRCMVTLNPMMPDEKLAQDITALQAPVIFALPTDWARPAIREAAFASGALCLELTGSAEAPVRVLQALGEGPFRSRADGIGIEMLTSGTTGVPKRIPLKAANFEKMIMDAAVFESRKAGEAPRLRSAVSILNTPFSHIGGLFGLFTTLSAGRRACMLERFEVGAFVDALERHRPKVVSASPPALRMILDAGVPRKSLESLSVFRTGTAPLDPDLADAFYEAYGIPVLQNYGATEFAGGVAGWTMADFKTFGSTKRGSVGRLNPGISARIVAPESGEPLPHDEQGLLELRGSHLADGKQWLRTTDLARLDADGFLWILGRADNAIIRGGFKIMPDDVVKVIESHPAVREACVLSLPDARLGQVPVAAYLLKSGAVLETADLKGWLRERLTAYQVPVRFLHLEDMPRTPSMKPSQPELRKLFEATAA